MKETPKAWRDCFLILDIHIKVHKRNPLTRAQSYIIHSRVGSFTAAMFQWELGETIQVGRLWDPWRKWVFWDCRWCVNTAGVWLKLATFCRHKRLDAGKPEQTLQTWDRQTSGLRFLLLVLSWNKSQILNCWEIKGGLLYRISAKVVVFHCRWGGKNERQKKKKSYCIHCY